MSNRIAAKRAVKKTMGWLEIFLNSLSRSKEFDGVCVFYYHRVAEPGFIDAAIDDRCVSASIFERQIAALAEFAEIVPLDSVPGRLAEKGRPRRKPPVCLTFDDGYANFLTSALPILERYHAPATVSVVTGLIGTLKPAPFDIWARKNVRRLSDEAWRLMSWSEVERCAASPLVTIGSHSHRHLKGRHCSPEEIREEVELSAEILRRRLGARHAAIYAYPYGNSYLGDVNENYMRAVRAAGFSLAVTTDSGLVSPDVDLYRLPRLEIHDLDTAGTLRAKASGAILPLQLKDAFHKFAARRGIKTPAQALADFSEFYF